MFCETIMLYDVLAKQAFAWKQDPVPEGHQPTNQPANRPAGWPNLDARRRSFRRRNVNRRPSCTWAPVEIACVISFAEVWPRSMSRHRKFQVVTRSAATSQPTRWDNRVPLPTYQRPLRDYVSGSSVRTPCYRSLSVIDERHFSNDSPTCDFSILERGSIERQTRTLQGV